MAFFAGAVFYVLSSMVRSLRQRKRIPKLREIALVWRTLLVVVPLDINTDIQTPMLEHGWRESQKGVPNYRIKSQTHGRVWMVDVYCGGYYIATVGDRFPEACQSLPSLVYYLRRMLSP